MTLQGNKGNTCQQTMCAAQLCLAVSPGPCSEVLFLLSQAGAEEGFGGRDPKQKPAGPHGHANVLLGLLHSSVFCCAHYTLWWMFVPVVTGGGG